MKTWLSIEDPWLWGGTLAACVDAAWLVALSEESSTKFPPAHAGTNQQVPGASPPKQERFETVRIDPLGEQLAKELVAMKNDFIEVHGRSGGLLATSLISPQLGNTGQGGEFVSFLRHEGADNYAFEVRGLKKSRLRASRDSGSAISDAPDVSPLARYQHPSELVDP